uniref:Uncharacterized protein n=1 Tax=Coccidioides posadasii RMSCC 3488 TaxID=454284 RepID=A0A0J6FII3_COCPO|nr:hypothetical protein CPAG_04964 [Coccidioides posadasii RMSCC 3488]
MPRYVPCTRLAYTGIGSVLQCESDLKTVWHKTASYVSMCWKLCGILDGSVRSVGTEGLSFMIWLPRTNVDVSGQKWISLTPTSLIVLFLDRTLKIVVNTEFPDESNSTIAGAIIDNRAQTLLLSHDPFSMLLYLCLAVAIQDA